MATPTSKTYLYSLLLIFIYMFSGRLEANLKNYDFTFNIRWSKSLSDYEKGKLATFSETYEEKWHLTVHNSYSATLHRDKFEIEVLPILRDNNFTGLIRAKTSDLEKFLQLYVIERDPNMVAYQVLDLKFHDYFNQKYAFKVDKSNTTLIEIIVLPELQQ